MIITNIDEFARHKKPPIMDGFFLTYSKVTKILSDFLVGRGKLILRCTAERAYPIIGKVLESGSRFHSIIGIALFRIIDVTTYITYVFLHFCSPYKIFFRSGFMIYRSIRYSWDF